MRYLLTPIISLLLIFAGPIQAKDLTEATDELCQKMKACGQEQLAKQEVPPEMRQMMEGMFDGMCKSMVAPYVISTKDAGLEKKAIACLDSFSDKSCKDLMENNGGDTKECQDFEEAAEKAYPDGYPKQ